MQSNGSNDLSINPELAELGRQLSCPSGSKGVEIGKMMNEVNIGMISSSITALNIQTGDKVLELGHGNGGHIRRVLDAADDVRYSGVELSETMHHEAVRTIKDSNDAHRAELILYNGGDLPFADHSFDKFFTVNTIYFWPDPVATFREIARVLKPGIALRSENAIAVVTYAPKAFMKGLPFVGNEFKLYDDADVTALVKAAGLKLIRIHNLSEQVRSKAGDFVERQYSVALMQRPPHPNS